MTASRWSLVVLLVVAFGLRLWDVGAPSVWHDEGWSIRAIRDPIGTPDDNTPPVYYALMHVLWLGAGESELALRYGSVLLGLLTVALGAALAARWAGEAAGFAAGALLTLSPLLWAYAREIRAYVAVPLLALLLLALADRLLAARRFAWRAWVAILGAELVLLYTHNLSVPVVAWLNIAVGAAWLWGRRWRDLAIWATGQAALGAAYLPWMLGQTTSGTPLNTPPVWRPRLLWDIWQGYFAPLPTMIGAEDALVVGSAALGVILLLAAVVLLARRPSRAALLALSQAALLPLLATALLRAAHIDFHPRYYVAGVPAALLVIACGAASLPRGWAHRLAAAGVVIVGAAVGVIALRALHDEPQYQHDDFRALAKVYAALPAETLIVVPYGWEPALEEYYLPKLGVRAQVVGVPLHSDADKAIETINAALAGRGDSAPVELLTWYQLPADLRGMYPCLLEAAGRRADRPPITVQGLTTTAYEVERPLALAAWDPPPARTETLGLVGASRAGNSALCISTAWGADPGRSEDWRVSARLTTTAPPGWVIARSDSDIRDAAQRPTPRIPGLVKAQAYSLLRLPPGAPPGHYAVQLVAFSAEHPDGVDWQQGGVPAGRVLTLPPLDLPGATDTPFAEQPPVVMDREVAPGVTLVGHDANADAPLNPGQEARITLWWRAHEVWAAGKLALTGAGWQILQDVAAYPANSLDWHAFRVPAEAAGGVVLTLEVAGREPLLLARYTVEAADRLFAAPPFEYPLGAEFAGLAVLEGFDLPKTAVSPDSGLDLTLVWRALGASDVSYRVFTHLLDDAGQVIAQDDDYPLDGARPTTSWAPGEYLADPYHLTFLPERAGYRGAARLEVGFYDPATGARVPLAGGGDHVLLPVELRVQ